MTYEELKAEATRQGYNLIKKPERLLPCVCGNKRREHISRYDRDLLKWVRILRCSKCGLSVECNTEKEAISVWNKMIRYKNHEQQKHIQGAV